MCSAKPLMAAMIGLAMTGLATSAEAGSSISLPGLFIGSDNTIRAPGLHIGPDNAIRAPGLWIEGDAPRRGNARRDRRHGWLQAPGVAIGDSAISAAGVLIRDGLLRAPGVTIGW